LTIHKTDAAGGAVATAVVAAVHASMFWQSGMPQASHEFGTVNALITAGPLACSHAGPLCSSG
jgi:hypothetical protein